MSFVSLIHCSVCTYAHYILVKIKDFLQTFQGKKDVTSVFADIDLDGNEDQSGEPRRALKYMDQLVREYVSENFQTSLTQSHLATNSQP